MYHFLLFSVHLAIPSFFSSPSRLRPPLPLPQTFSKTTTRRRRRKRKWAKRVCLWLTLGNASEERVRTGGGGTDWAPSLPPRVRRASQEARSDHSFAGEALNSPNILLRHSHFFHAFFVGNRIFISHLFPLLNPLPSRPRGHGKHGGRGGAPSSCGFSRGSFLGNHASAVELVAPAITKREKGIIVCLNCICDNKRKYI